MVIFHSYVKLPEGISSFFGAVSTTGSGCLFRAARLYPRHAPKATIKTYMYDEPLGGRRVQQDFLGFHMDFILEDGYDVVKGSLILFHFCLEMGIYLYIYNYIYI